MLKSIFTPMILSVALATAAVAGSPVANPSSGSQLAASAGVQPGEYTAAELQNIIDARRDNDASKLAFYLSGENRKQATDTSNAGLDQLAQSAGVQPGRYTAAELVQIIEAKRDNDMTRLSFYLTGANRTAPNDASVVTPGEAQLAASTGLDPAQHTLAELVAASDTTEN